MQACLLDALRFRVYRCFTRLRDVNIDMNRNETITLNVEQSDNKIKVCFADSNESTLTHFSSNYKKLKISVVVYCLSYFSTSSFIMVNSIPACLNISIVSASA